MERTLATVSDPVLPVFAVPVLGFVMSLGKMLVARDAKSINRFVLFLAVGSRVATLSVLALQYGERPDAIARAIVYSTTLSVVTLAMLA